MRTSRRRKGKKKEKEEVGYCKHLLDNTILNDVIRGDSRFSQFKRRIMKCLLVSTSNRRSFEYFKSTQSIQVERKRHLTRHFYMIHPLSSFRFYWELFMVIFLPFAIIISPLNVWLTIEVNSHIQSFLLVSTVMTAIDILLHFFTGKCNSDTKEIVMQRKDVTWRYLKGMFVFDLLCFIPHEVPLLVSEGYVVFVLLVPLNMLQTFRILRFFSYYDNTLKVFNATFFMTRCSKMLLSVVYLIHSVACYHYALVSWVELLAQSSLIDKNEWLGKIRLQKLSTFEEYVRSLFRVTQTFTGTCMSLSKEGETEQNMYMIFLIIGQSMFFVIIATVMFMIKSHRASSSMYEEMITQLHQFMTSKNLSPKLKTRALDYYDFRYYKCYYLENEIMESVSNILRQDIILHNCKLLVDNVPFFKHLPKALKQRIVMLMRNKYYQSEDVIINLGERGDRMYFIKSGTVAVYSSAKKELCHLEDGDYFGEISVVLEEEERVASVVAIEDCELYCLQRIDFLIAVEDYPEVLDEIVAIALQRRKQAKSIS